MNEWVGRWPDSLVSAEASLDREFEERLRDSSALAFSIAYGYALVACFASMIFLLVSGARPVRPTGVKMQWRRPFRPANAGLKPRATLTRRDLPGPCVRIGAGVGAGVEHAGFRIDDNRRVLSHRPRRADAELVASGDERRAHGLRHS